MSDFKHRTTEEARDALRRFIDRKPVMTIPVDNERDADCILYDVLAERDFLVLQLRAATQIIDCLHGRLIERRAMEPKHSREDHDCPECEMLDAARRFGKDAEKRHGEAPKVSAAELIQSWAHKDAINCEQCGGGPCKGVAGT